MGLDKFRKLKYLVRGNLLKLLQFNKTLEWVIKGLHQPSTKKYKIDSGIIFPVLFIKQELWELIIYVLSISYLLYMYLKCLICIYICVYDALVLQACKKVKLTMRPFISYEYKLF